jgi:hypothetical protein
MFQNALAPIDLESNKFTINNPKFFLEKPFYPIDLIP